MSRKTVYRYSRLALFDLLQERAVNKAEFARRLGIDRRRLYQIERGILPFPPDLKAKTAELLDKPESVLFRESLKETA